MNLSKKRLQKKFLLATSLLFTVISSSSYSFNDINLNKVARPPYHIKPNTPFLAPSGYSPSQIRTAYGLNQITNQGAGQTIAIVDAYDNPNIEADLGVFSSTFNLPACTTANGCFQKIYASGQQPAGNASWGVEIALDVQWAHAIAPQAKIMLVEATDAGLGSLLSAVQVAVQKGANVISMSWGAGEFSTEAQYDSYFNVANVSFTASTGDSGTGVEWPSVSPYVIATGGTSLNITSTGGYISETAWSGSGGGISSYIKLPAYQANFADQYNPNKMRSVPDVSMVADPNTGVSVYDTYGQNGWLVLGGTSAAAPAWAGVIAITNAQASTKLPNLNSLLYSAATTAYSNDYHDIILGSNGSCGAVCTARIGYDYVTGLGSPISQNLIKTITGDSGTCTRSAPTVTYYPNTAQTIQPGGSVTVNFSVINNDSSACPASTFTLTPSANNSLIAAAVTTPSLTVKSGNSKASAAMIVKASNTAVVGETYTATLKIADNAINRSTGFNSVVTIGNPFK